MSPKGAGALGRFTLIDLTRVRLGPTCVRQLADFGANVIKIEMPPRCRAQQRDDRAVRATAPISKISIATSAASRSI